MKGFYGKFDRFCSRNERFGIKNLMMIIVIISAVIYVLGYMSQSNPYFLYNKLCFSPYHILKMGQVWRIITYVIAPNPATGIFGLAISLFFYLFIGRVLEQQWGRLKFTIFYFSGVIITAVFGLVFRCSISSAYINLSMFMAFATLYPDQRVMFYFIIPIKIKWLAYLSIIYYVYVMIINRSLFPANLVPIAALINYAIYFAPMFFAMTANRKRHRQWERSKVVDFEEAKNRPGAAARAQHQKPNYMHKCEVCGRTNVSHPELEFRYCSKCAGYRCYCIDHINNHNHITEE
ncbi:MAG: rhomboid family intramembrane serine protease [Oscillospiraceae bacterium]|nr:rhomboid family intramembrane serine protease [Oscillospiraceae bacterium]